jgi:hypothetical protein
MIRGTVVALVALVAFPLIVDAQESRVYVGGTFNFVTQTHSAREPIGGTTQGGSALFGVQVSPRVAIEFEPSLAGRYSWRYTYSPSPSLTANVVASRRDTFFPIQARIRLGVLEPVVGVAFVHGRISRHATVGTGTYFDDGRSDDNLAFVGGVDAALNVAAHFYLVPTFRLLVSAPGATPDSPGDPLGAQTSTGFIRIPVRCRRASGVLDVLLNVERPAQCRRHSRRPRDRPNILS